MTAKKIWIGIAVIVVCACTAGGYVAYNHLINYGQPKIEESEETKEISQTYNIPYALLKQKAETYNLDQSVCFYVDYSIPSGTHRFFICDIKTDTVLYSDYCMHGPGKGSTAETPVFSNEIGSKCSSLGAFSVCKKRWGATMGEKRSRLIKGLDSTNNNAIARTLMIHDSYYLKGKVNALVVPKYIPLDGGACSGCVTITPAGFQKVLDYVRNTKKEILLYTSK